VLTLAFAVVIGIALGMLGGGGSILTVPVFTYVAGLDPKVAIAASLPVVAIISAFGALGHWRAGNVELRTAFTLGVFTMIGGFAGARGAVFLSGQAQMLIFAAVMIAASVSMLRGASLGPVVGPSAPRLPTMRIAPLGLGVGMLTGVVGVGGGFLIVPALVKLANLPMRVAVGTSLAVIAMNATAGTLGYLGKVSMPVALLLPFTLIALLGTAIGTGAAQRVPQATLRRGFALLLLVVSGFILYQNRAVLEGAPSAVTTAPVDSVVVNPQGEV
jgi:uncharacterized membrane protein YfcA